MSADATQTPPPKSHVVDAPNAVVDGAPRVVAQATGLGKTYPNGTRALDGIDLTITNERFTVILGSSGAGKSTLIRCLNRLVEPSEGTLVFFGDDITHISGRKLRHLRGRVGMIFQQFNLVRRLRVIDNVLSGRLRFARGPMRLARSMWRSFPSAEQDLAFECLRQVGIEHLAYQRADTLSGGQQQRVAIARALAQEPDLILADEPIASLDPRSSQVVMEILAQIQAERDTPVVVNLHQVDFARSFGERVIGMSAGRIVWDGPGGELNDAALTGIYDGNTEALAAELAAELPAAVTPRGDLLPDDEAIAINPT